MPTKPSLSSAFSMLQAPKTAAPINWGAASIKPPAATFGFSPAAPALPSINTGTQTTSPMATASALAPKAPAPSQPATFGFLSAPAMPSINMGMAGTTSTTTMPRLDPSTATSAPTYNSQSNDTALRPGQFGAGPFATINPDGTSTPSAYSQMPAKPSITPADPVKMNSGAVADPNTGAMIASSEAPAATASNTGNTSSASSYSASAGGAPTQPYTGGGSDPSTAEADDWFKKYKESLAPSAEEEESMKRLDDLNEAASTAYVNTQNQPIALPFITGQQAAIQRSKTNLAAPLEAYIARAQAKRQIASNVSKAALDRMDAQAKEKRDAATKAAEAAESARRFGVTEAGNAQERALAEKKFNEDVRQFGLQYALDKQKAATDAAKVAAEKAASVQDPAKTLDQIALVEGSIERAEKLANSSGNTGVFGKTGRFLTGADSYTNLVAETNTLRTNALTMMTDPTIKKFFGPQMSNADVQLMTSAGTTLNPELQTPAFLKAELGRLKDLVSRAKAAVQEGTGAGQAPQQMELNGKVYTRQADGTYL